MQPEPARVDGDRQHAEVVAGAVEQGEHQRAPGVRRPSIRVAGPARHPGVDQRDDQRSFRGIESQVRQVGDSPVAVVSDERHRDAQPRRACRRHETPVDRDRELSCLAGLGMVQHHDTQRREHACETSRAAIPDAGRRDAR